MNNYNIILLHDELYDALVVLCSSDSPLAFISDIEKDLSNENIKGRILIDQILHVGNNDERFIVADFDGKKMRKEKLAFEKIPKSSSYRSVSCQFLRQSGVVDFSILNSVQKRMIDNGISI